METTRTDRPSVLLELNPITQTYAPVDWLEDEAESVRFPLSHYLWILRRYRWRILGWVVASVIATLAISTRITPMFESTVTIDIDRQTPPGIVGDDATRSALNDADQFLATQIKLVESDSVLRPVDQRLRLRDSEGQPIDDSPTPEAPIALRRLRVSRPPNTYLLLVSYRSADPQLAADAANAIAESYIQHGFDVRIRSSAALASFMERQLDELRAKMERSGQALAGFERDLNVVNPEEKINILGSRLLQLNSELTNAQAERLKQEAAYQSVQALIDGSAAAGDAPDAALEAPQGEALRKLVDRRNEAQERFAEVRSHYGSNHPEFRKAQAQLAQLNQSIADAREEVARRVQIELRQARGREDMLREATSAAKQEFDRVNARSFEYQALKREADADKSLYEELVKKIREAGINSGFQNSAIRIADPARPAVKPISPNLPLNGMLALLFSSFVGISGAVLSDVLDTTVRDPEQAARTLSTPVIGNLPLMKNRARGLLATSGSSRAATVDQDLSSFEESIRTLRNSILLDNLERPYRTLLITSASPGEGKTTTAAHLAASHAGQGKRTLLIDGDLRRPSVHRAYQMPSVVGLSNVLLGELRWREVVMHPEEIDHLDILPAGPPTGRASDLMGRGIAEILEEAVSEYDLIILDAPPLLGFAEPLQMAITVDGVVVVARAGQTTRKAVAAVLGTLSRLRAKVVGLVLNEVHAELSDSYRYYGYYRSYYRDSRVAAKDSADETVD